MAYAPDTHHGPAAAAMMSGWGPQQVRGPWFPEPWQAGVQWQRHRWSWSPAPQMAAQLLTRRWSWSPYQASGYTLARDWYWRRNRKRRRRRKRRNRRFWYPSNFRNQYYWRKPRQARVQESPCGTTSERPRNPSSTDESFVNKTEITSSSEGSLAAVSSEPASTEGGSRTPSPVAASHSTPAATSDQEPNECGSQVSASREKSPPKEDGGKCEPFERSPSLDDFLQSNKEVTSPYTIDKFIQSSTAEWPSCALQDPGLSESERSKSPLIASGSKSESINESISGVHSLSKVPSAADEVEFQCPSLNTMIESSVGKLLQTLRSTGEEHDPSPGSEEPHDPSPVRITSDPTPVAENREIEKPSEDIPDAAFRTERNPMSVQTADSRHSWEEILPEDLHSTPVPVRASTPVGSLVSTAFGRRHPCLAALTHLSTQIVLRGDSLQRRAEEMSIDVAQPSPDRSRNPSPERSRSPSPERPRSPSAVIVASPSSERSRSPSPVVVASPSPERSRSPSPEGSRSPSPVVVASPSPERSRSPSPVAVASPSPERSRSPSPVAVASQSPERPRSPSPEISSSPSPTVVASPSPERSRSPSAERPRSPSAVIVASPSSERFRSPSTVVVASPSPERSRSPSPEGSRSPSPVAVASPSTERSRSPSPVAVASQTPERSRSPSPEISSSPSPTVVASPSPERSRSPSAVVVAFPSQKRSRSPSPERSSSLSPFLVGFPSQKRSRSPSPERSSSLSPFVVGFPSQKRSRSPSPERSSSLSPFVVGFPSPERSRSPSPERSSSLSPFVVGFPSQKRSRSPSPERSRSPSPERSRSPSPERSRSPSPERSSSLSPFVVGFPSQKRSKSPSPERSRSPSPERSRSPSPAVAVSSGCMSKGRSEGATNTVEASGDGAENESGVRVSQLVRKRCLSQSHDSNDAASKKRRSLPSNTEGSLCLEREDGSSRSSPAGVKRARRPPPDATPVSGLRADLLATLQGGPHSAPPFSPGNTVLTRAATGRLLRRVPNHSLLHISNKREEIFQAVEEGKVERVQQLVQDVGPAIRRADTSSTLLHAAASSSQLDVLIFLLQLISPNVVDDQGQTPAHAAAAKGNTQVLRILLADQQMKSEKRDNCSRTYKDLLSVPLIEAVAKGNRSRVQELVKLGADPDYRVETLQVGGQLEVTTARQLAVALNRQDIMRCIPKERPPEAPLEVCPSHTFSGNLQPTSTASQLSPALGPDIYQVEGKPRGHVCILSYSSFKDRPDLLLDGSRPDVLNLANVFGKMGYSGHAYESLTAGQTQQALTTLRDSQALDQADCAVFVISSHGVGEEKFLTSDMKLLTTEWICDLFKDSECPRLRDKPKIFIFDFWCGYYKEESGRRERGRGRGTRVEEPLRDMMCLYSSSGGFTSYSFNREGTPFTRVWCHTLQRSAHEKELVDLYREFLMEYSKTSPASMPQLRNIGFTKRFYFNPVTR